MQPITWVLENLLTLIRDVYTPTSHSDKCTLKGIWQRGLLIRRMHVLGAFCLRHTNIITSKSLLHNTAHAYQEPLIEQVVHNNTIDTSSSSQYYLMISSVSLIHMMTLHRRDACTSCNLGIVINNLLKKYWGKKHFFSVSPKVLRL